MSENPVHHYREVAKAIVTKLKSTMVETLETGKMADPYWKLEQAIVDAMKHADEIGSERTQQKMTAVLSEFNDENGTSSN